MSESPGLYQLRFEGAGPQAPLVEAPALIQAQVAMPEVLVPPTVYTAGQLHTRNRRRQFVTTDGRFMLRADGRSGFYYWHGTEKKDGKTVVGSPIKGPEGVFYAFFTKEHALDVLNKICGCYGY